MIDKTKEISITTPYLTLGQLLKIADIINSGGQAKEFLKTAKVAVNDISENRRGRKLYPGDKIVCGDQKIVIKANAD